MPGLLSFNFFRYCEFKLFIEISTFANMKNCSNLLHRSKRTVWGALKNTNLTFNFTITYGSPALFGNHYSEYQFFLYKTIIEHREKGMTFDAIAEWLNKEEYLTVRGSSSGALMFIQS